MKKPKANLKNRKRIELPQLPSDRLEKIIHTSQTSSRTNGKWWTDMMRTNPGLNKAEWTKRWRDMSGSRHFMMSQYEPAVLQKLVKPSCTHARGPWKQGGKLAIPQSKVLPRENHWGVSEHGIWQTLLTGRSSHEKGRWLLLTMAEKLVKVIWLRIEKEKRPRNRIATLGKHFQK